MKSRNVRSLSNVLHLIYLMTYQMIGLFMLSRLLSYQFFKKFKVVKLIIMLQVSVNSLPFYIYLLIDQLIYKKCM